MKPGADPPSNDAGSLLAIDIGNSQITIGLGDDVAWNLHWRLASDRRRTADEYGALLSALLTSEGVAPRAIERIVLTSVVPELGGVIEAMCERLFDLRPLVVGPGIRTGMALRYQPPNALGSDRLVDAVAARERFGAPVIVVDFGTATTFNVVDAEGDFIGGAIAPGVQTAASALAAAGARLHRIDLSPPDLESGGLPIVGRNTEQGMRSGILHGYAGLVDGLLERITGAMRERARNTDDVTEAAEVDIPIIATGGMSRSIAPLVDRFTALEPDLILDGLRIIDRLNPRDEAQDGSRA